MLQRFSFQKRAQECGIESVTCSRRVDDMRGKRRMLCIAMPVNRHRPRRPSRDNHRVRAERQELLHGCLGRRFSSTGDEPALVEENNIRKGDQVVVHEQSALQA